MATLLLACLSNMIVYLPQLGLNIHLFKKQNRGPNTLLTGHRALGLQCRRLPHTDGCVLWCTVIEVVYCQALGCNLGTGHKEEKVNEVTATTCKIQL